jgi:hypothetical protein
MLLLKAHWCRIFSKAVMNQNLLFFSKFLKLNLTKVILKRQRNQDYKKNEGRGKAIPVRGSRGL